MIGIFFLIILMTSDIVTATDMRANNIAAQKNKNALMEKARMDAEMARKEAEESTNRILSDRNDLKKAISELKQQNLRLEKENQNLEYNLTQLANKENNLTAQLEEVDSVVKELVGFVRAGAKDLDALIDQSLQSSFAPNRGSLLKFLTNESKFPGMDDIHQMFELLFDEIKKSGEVRIENGPLVNRAGEDVSGKILLIGNFTAAYRIPKETGFLIYSDKSRRFFALSKLPPSRITKKIKQYMSGNSEDVPIDISRGAALRQLTHRLSLLDQIKKGGPIVWPILGIGLIALAIIIERLVYLFRSKMDSDNLMNQIHTLALDQAWEKCKEACSPYLKKPVPRILFAGINCCMHTNREDMENVVQEAILREVPRLERFLSTLGMLAAIAPLLGLLGTVTGMINTFQMITYYGTGDPRMMSGGISEALVTTMLGLSVAIPIMLCHTFLSRRVETVIGEMEEKAVSFINTVFKIRNGH
ncbi:MAG: DUF3450 family protein [Desulfobacterales bacterium]|nr:DUF3450 family protein [Desulfobacterales bacterium]